MCRSCYIYGPMHSRLCLNVLADGHFSRYKAHIFSGTSRKPVVNNYDDPFYASCDCEKRLITTTSPVAMPTSHQSRTAHFLPLPPRSLSAPPPPYHLPHLITTYSHLPDRSIVHNDTSMAYYKPAPIGCDLNYGFDNKIERDEDVDEHLDGLCEALKEVWENGGQAERKGGVITWRGMITRCVFI
jgi:hypothetical protein